MNTATRVRALLWLAAAAAAIGLLAALAPMPMALAAESPLELIERGRWREARTILEPRVAANPADAEAAWLLSRVRAAYDDTKEALELAEKAVALDDNDARFHEQLAMVLGDKAQNAGPLSQMGLARRFKKEADRAVTLDPRRFDAQQALVTFYWKAPGIAGGSKDKARAKADEILALDPVEGRLAHARLAMERGDTTTAIEHYRKAVAAGPTNYEARIALASRLAQRPADAAAGEREALEARRLDRGRVGAWSLLAGLYAHAGRWEELDALLAESRSAIPGNRSPEYAAARQMIVEHREPARAEHLLRDYLTVEPDPGAPTHAHARWRLANALEQQDRREEAIAELQTALRLNPDLDLAEKDLKRMRKQT